jgi:hypothetical protein
MYIVTGASQNHHKSLIQLTISFLKYHKNDENYKLIIYDLGIDEIDWEKIKKLFSKYTNIIFKTFNYSIYPEFVNIKYNTGEYAWKPIIIYDTCIEYQDIIVWMDAGNIIIQNLENIKEIIKKTNLYSGYSIGKVKDYVHPKTLEYMDAYNIHPKILDVANRNGACLGFNYKTNYVQEFVKEYRDLCLIKECIAPEGSNRSNHRQDQSVYTLLYVKYFDLYKFLSIDVKDQYKYYKIHNDIDE